jgi:hypothetical protein
MSEFFITATIFILSRLYRAPPWPASYPNGYGLTPNLPVQMHPTYRQVTIDAVLTPAARPCPRGPQRCARNRSMIGSILLHLTEEKANSSVEWDRGAISLELILF